jgi:UDP-N-acetylglucosamine 2-epimerase (non-hydrolysing)
VPAHRQSTSLKLLMVAGARPNFMKVAPLVRAVNARAANGNGSCTFHSRLVHTGQHYDAAMSDVFFTELGLPKPDINLEAGSGSHAVQTARIMERFDAVCEDERPDWVLVVGDVNSTVACTLVCAKRNIKVAHVEAGLRSFDRSMPEEINRIVTDAIADLLLTPSQDADENLRREGISPDKIRLVGNVMIDSLVDNVARSRQRKILQTLGLEPRRFVYVTLHRPSNVDDAKSLSEIMARLSELSSKLPVVFPIHPRTRKRLAESRVSTPLADGLKLIDPIGYHDSLCLTEHARFVLTDSGGLQEESTFFRTPCLTLRPNTERPVTVDIGSNRLTTASALNRDIEQVLAKPERIGAIPPLWDGHSADRILDAIASASLSR